jgi:predicted GTPase
MMLDASYGLTEEDIEIYNTVKEKKILVLINKIDVDNKKENTQK